MKPRSNPFLRPAQFVAAIALSASPVAHAAPQTWGSSTTGNWSDGTKWLGGTAPGATSGLTNTDLATFTNAAGGTISINLTTQNIGSITNNSTVKYTIGSAGVNLGNSLFLSSGGSIATTGGAGITFDAPLVLAPASPTTAGSYTFSNTSSTPVMTIAGNVTGGTTTQGVNLNLFGTSVTRGNSIVTGAISDGGAAGGLSVTAGDNSFTMWVLSGNNSYTGVTNVNGRLNIRSINALGSTVGGTVVTNNGNAALELQGAGISYAAEALSLSGTGNGGNGALRNISGNNTWTGAITLAGAANIISNANTLTIDVASGNAITATNQNLTLGGAGNGEVKDAIATGSGTLTKVDAGTWTLSASNSYSGLTTVTSGALSVTGSLNSGNALTVGASGTANFANASQNLGAVSNANTATNALNFSNASGTVVLASLTGAGNTRFGSAGTVTGGISTGTVTSVGALNANISGGAITSGGLLTGTISSGTVGANSLSSTSVTGGTNTITGAAAITTLNGGTTTVGGVATIVTMTSGTANLNGATSAITTLNGGTVNLGSSTVLNVSNGTTTGDITGSGSLTKTSAGTLTLTGNKSYTGTTAVNDGKLIVNGSISTAVTVNSGGTLGGGGTVGAVIVQGGGFIAPGNSPGILNTGDYSQAGTYNAELTGTTAGVGGYDQINVTGTVSITGGSLVTNFNTFTPVNGDLLFILLNDSTDPITGTYTGLAQGATVTSFGGFNWKISYTANSGGSPSFIGGNDIALMAIPEPNVAALLGGLGMLTLLRRRR